MVMRYRLNHVKPVGLHHKTIAAVADVVELHVHLDTFPRSFQSHQEVRPDGLGAPAGWRRPCGRTRPSCRRLG